MLLISPADGEPFPPRRASRYAATIFMVEEGIHARVDCVKLSGERISMMAESSLCPSHCHWLGGFDGAIDFDR